MPDTRKMLLRLPFVAEKKDGTLDLWRVRPTGCRDLDRWAGHGYAMEFIAVCKALDNPTILHHVFDAARAHPGLQESEVWHGFLLGLGFLVAASHRGHLTCDALLPPGRCTGLAELPFVTVEDGKAFISEADFRSGGSYSDDVSRGTYYGAAIARYTRDTGNVSACREISRAASRFSELALGVRVGLNSALCQCAMSAAREDTAHRLTNFECEQIEFTARLCPV